MKVFVGAPLPGEPAPDAGKDARAVEAIEGAEERPSGLTELEHRDRSSGAHHACHLLKPSCGIVHVPDAEGDRGDVEGPVRVGKPERVRLLEARPEPLARGLLPRDLDHFGAEIDSDHGALLPHRALELERQIAGPGGAVEDPVPRRGAAQAHRGLPPAMVEAHREHLVAVVVPPRDGGEHVAHLGAHSAENTMPV